MTTIDFRSGTSPDYYLDIIHDWNGPPLTFMEVCGTHTMSVRRSQLQKTLPDSIRLISGPGCPVCVTPVAYIDRAFALSHKDSVTITTFGDLMRVPGSLHDDSNQPPTLNRARAEGADIRVLYSPLDAIKLAAETPDRNVIFLGVGFETTAPTLAASIQLASDMKLPNFSMLVAAKTIPEAMGVLAKSEKLKLDGFLSPGHVSCIIGTLPYKGLGLPSAISGFEPVEILRGIAALVTSCKDGSKEVINCYPGAVREEGNPRAKAMLHRIFKPCDAEWRGLGTIPSSGLALRDSLRGFDAHSKFNIEMREPKEPKGCRCGDILTGIITPEECPLFGKKCTPEYPVGACMVSTEGTCAAHYNYTDGEPR